MMQVLRGRLVKFGRRYKFVCKAQVSYSPGTYRNPTPNNKVSSSFFETPIFIISSAIVLEVWTVIWKRAADL